MATGGTGAHIVWFRRQKNFYDYDDMNLRLLPGVEPVAELADGVVLRVWDVDF